MDPLRSTGRRRDELREVFQMVQIVPKLAGSVERGVVERKTSHLVPKLMGPLRSTERRQGEAPELFRMVQIVPKLAGSVEREIVERKTSHLVPKLVEVI
jgi:hypothetical protein